MPHSRDELQALLEAPHAALDAAEDGLPDLAALLPKHTQWAAEGAIATVRTQADATYISRLHANNPNQPPALLYSMRAAAEGSAGRAELVGHTNLQPLRLAV